MADRIVVMNHGVIEQVGTASEVYERAGDAVRRRFRRQDQRAEATCARRRTLSSRRGRPDLAEQRRSATSPARPCASTCAPRTGTSKATSQACRTGCADGSHASSSSARSAWPSCAATRSGSRCMISYSLNQLHDLDVREGADVDIALRVDRVRVFRRQRCRDEPHRGMSAIALPAPQRRRTFALGARRRGTGRARRPRAARAWRCSSSWRCRSRRSLRAASRIARRLRRPRQFAQYVQSPALAQSIWNTLTFAC